MRLPRICSIFLVPPVTVVKLTQSGRIGGSCQRPALGFGDGDAKLRKEEVTDMRKTGLLALLLPLLLVLALVAACSGSEEVAPPPAPAPAAAAAAPAGVSAAEVASIVRQAVQAQPQGASTADVAGAIQAAMSSRPGVTETQVADAIAKAIADRPGITGAQVANTIAQALRQQTPGLTESEVVAAITSALEDRPGVSAEDIKAAVDAAVAMAMPAPAMSSGDGMMAMGKKGGILRYGMGPNVEHVFHLTYSGGACAAWCMTVGDPLTAYGPDSEWDRPKSLAESFTMSEDRMTVTFKLKEGLLFHDGTDVNADAIKFSLDWVLDPDNPVVTRSAVASISNVEVIDNLRVAITTNEVFAPIITNLGMTAGMPVSPTAFAELGQDKLEADGTVSTGPFMVEEWVSGSHIDFTAFTDYHQEGLPYLDGWRWVVIPDEQVRAAAMQAEEIDVTGVGASAQDAIQSMRSIPDVQEMKSYAGPRMDHFNAARAPFDDIRVRKAAQMAMDRHAWDQAMHSGEGFIYTGSLVPPTHAASFSVSEEEFPYKYDPEGARALLEEYAAEKGISLPISTMAAFTCTPEQKEGGCVDLPQRPITITTSSAPANIRRAELSKAYYDAVGFEVEMDIGSGDEAKRTFVTKEASFSLRGFGLRPHPSGTFNSYLGYGGYWNNGGWGTSDEQLEIDRLVRTAAQSFDPLIQNSLYRQAQKIYMEAVLGGVRTSAGPGYHFMQPTIKWAQFPDQKWVKYPSDASLHIHEVWLDQ